tara:strand:- start:279 stop:500 length:222 start_codon:yes stop_codon:yes gene_type:complete
LGYLCDSWLDKSKDAAFTNFFKDFSSKFFFDTIFGISSKLINFCLSNFFTDVFSVNISTWAMLSPESNKNANY